MADPLSTKVVKINTEQIARGLAKTYKRGRIHHYEGHATVYRKELAIEEMYADEHWEEFREEACSLYHHIRLMVAVV